MSASSPPPKIGSRSKKTPKSSSKSGKKVGKKLDFSDSEGGSGGEGERPRKRKRTSTGGVSSDDRVSREVVTLYEKQLQEEKERVKELEKNYEQLQKEYLKLSNEYYELKGKDSAYAGVLKSRDDLIKLYADKLGNYCSGANSLFFLL